MTQWRRGRLFLQIFCFVLAGAFTQSLLAQTFHNATDDKDVVKNKLFPKNKKFEIVGPDFGVILNESYISTYLLHLGGTYYTSEEWGFGLDLAFAMANSDKFERTCIENFYNDPKYKVDEECAKGDPAANKQLQDSGGSANMGPAYVPIREVKMILTANATWNPLYGKQLFAHTATSYFDMYLTFGGGIARSDVYPKSTKLRDGRPSRALVINESNPAGTAATGADPSETTLYGEAGRPDPETQTNLVLMTGIGQKYHFLEHFNVKMELRNYILLGTESGFDTFFTLWGGVGMRF